jgi:hypothetical protein
MCCSASEVQQAPAPPTHGMEQQCCSYAAWFPRYQQHALRSVVVELPDEFVAYLLEDGIVVGDASGAVSVSPCDRCTPAPVLAAAADPPSARRHDSCSTTTLQMPRRAAPTTTVADADEYADWSDSEGSDAGADQADWTARFPQLCAGG